MSSRKIQRISELIEDARRFRFCGPSDDPDEITAVCVGYRHLLIQLQRLAAPLLPVSEKERLESLDIEIDNIYSVYEVDAELETLLDDIEDVLAQADIEQLSVGTAANIIDQSVIGKLAAVPSSKFDTTFLVQMCKEINSCYAHRNIIATALIMRAVLNYIPPVFEQKTFEQVTAHSNRSVKQAFTHLQDGLRKIADFHTHRVITKRDVYPSSAQVEPYKPQFEILLHEVLSRLTHNG
jgi:hypothetical protein